MEKGTINPESDYCFYLWLGALHFETLLASFLEMFNIATVLLVMMMN